MKIVILSLFFAFVSCKSFAENKQKIAIDSGFLHAVLLDLTGSFFEIIPIYQNGHSHHSEILIKPSDIAALRNADFVLTLGNSDIFANLLKSNEKVISVLDFGAKNAHFWLDPKKTVKIYQKVLKKITSRLDKSLLLKAENVIRKIGEKTSQNLCKGQSSIDIFTSHGFNVDIDKSFSIKGFIFSENGDILPKNLAYLKRNKTCVVADISFTSEFAKKIHKDTIFVNIDADGISFGEMVKSWKSGEIIYLGFFEKNVAKICNCYI